MRSATRLAPLALLATLAAAGCGNYSTEDLRFLSALPTREDLHVVVPAPGTSAGALVSTAGYSAACPSGTTLGDATIWQWAKPTSDGLNKGVDFLVSLIDRIRAYPPTARHGDSRRWGPFDDKNHPGHEIQVLMDRSWPAGTGGPPSFTYAFQGRIKGTATWHDLITGTFTGHSSARGSGTVTLDFLRFHTVGIADVDTPYGSMNVAYDRASDPVTIDLTLAQGGFGVVSFGYRFTGYADGTGAFDYAFRNAAGDLLEVRTGYDAAHAGRLEVSVTPSGATSIAGSFRQCWDVGECLVYVDDSANFSCGTPPCSGGAIGACATVPASPF
jgi:hypothetical protein